MFWAVIIGFIGLMALGIGLTIWTGYEQPPKKGEPPKSPVVKTQEQRGSEKKFGAIMILVGLLIVSGAYGWYELYYQSSEQIESRQNAKVDRSCNDKITAYVMTHGPVKSRLKSPKSASFPTFRAAEVVSTGHCEFSVSAYVDAENSFGANIRTPYFAKIKYVPESGGWKLIEMVM